MCSPLTRQAVAITTRTTVNWLLNALRNNKVITINFGAKRARIRGDRLVAKQRTRIQRLRAHLAEVTTTGRMKGRPHASAGVFPEHDGT
jgi:hypothetical protein